MPYLAGTSQCGLLFLPTLSDIRDTGGEAFLNIPWLLRVNVLCNPALELMLIPTVHFFFWFFKVYANEACALAY